MIRPLRRWHLALMALVAILATVVLAAAVRARRPVPVMDRLPPALESLPRPAGGGR